MSVLAEVAELVAENARLRAECALLAKTAEARSRVAARALAGYQNRALSMELIRQKNLELVALNRDLARSLAELKSTQEQLFEAARSASLAEKETLERDMAIASEIQTSILPREVAVKGLEIAARMIPAAQVGGDYYDVLPVEGGCWLAIGDVTGHGLTAGLVMLMIQSVVAGITRQRPSALPSELLCVLNEVIFDNVRRRLNQREHATLSLLRYEESGRIVFAGAHEEMLVFRAGADRCETIPTPGPWLGVTRSVERFVVNSRAELERGDVMVLYTDGVTEAMDAKREQFGLERMSAALTEARGAKVEEIRDRLLEAVVRWTATQEDDITLVVMRQVGG